MTCKCWKEEWVAQLYGELDAAEQQRMSEHLEGCPRCRETLEQLESARSMLAGLPAPEPAAPRVVVLPQPRRRPVLAFAAGLACASVLFAVGMSAGAFFSRPVGETARQVSERQQALEARFESTMTRPQVEEALKQLQRRLELEQARNTQFLLEEINATEFRAGRWVDETRQAIQLVALQNDPRFSER